MSKTDVTEYFDATEFREIRDDLVFAVSKVNQPKVAIDCGCGAGADINYLLESGFVVYGFDVEEESITRCQTRFASIEGVTLSKASFSDFEYPKASLVVADASLFFCPNTDFKNVWAKICECLYPHGIFCGSFLGSEDTMAKSADNQGAFWPDVNSFEESDVKGLFKDFEILRFNTHRSSGKTSQGVKHSWHIFQVVARKSSKAISAHAG